MDDSRWWIPGLYINEVIAPHTDANPNVAKATIAALAGAHDDADIARVCGVLDVQRDSLFALCASPPADRAPFSSERPSWAAEILPASEAAVARPVFQDWAAKSRTAHLVAPLFGEVWEQVDHIVARLSDLSGLADLETGLLSKLIAMLDLNIAYTREGNSHLAGMDAESFWKDRPASLRHARALTRGFTLNVRNFDEALVDCPDFICMRDLQHLFIEPLDLHRGGTSLVLAEGAGVRHAREIAAFDHLNILLQLLRPEGVLTNWRVPRVATRTRGTWVEWIEGDDLEDLPASMSQELAPDLAAFAVLMWIFGGSGIEPEGIVKNVDGLFVVQVDGLFSPTLGRADELSQLRSWLDLFFDGQDMVSALEFDETCRESALSSLRAAENIADTLLAKVNADSRMVRSFARPMTAYSHLLRAVPGIAAAGDGIARELVFSRLRAAPPVFEGLHMDDLVKAEIADLKNYDLPYLTARPTGEDVFYSDGSSLRGLVCGNALEQIGHRLREQRGAAVEVIKSYGAER